MRFHEGTTVPPERASTARGVLLLKFYKGKRGGDMRVWAKQTRQGHKGACVPGSGLADESMPLDRPTDRRTDRSAHRPADGPTDRPNDRPTDPPTHRPTRRQAVRLTGRPTDRSTDRPTDRPPDRPTDRPFFVEVLLNSN